MLWWFGHQWSGESSEWGKVLVGGLLYTQSKCIRLVAWRWKKATASNYWIDYNFKPFRVHTFMPATKNAHLWPPTSCNPSSLSTKMNMWQILRPLPHKVIPLPCGHHKFMVSYMFAVCEKITIMLFEQNKPIIKILLKDICNPYNCGSSVKVNGICDGWILCDTMRLIVVILIRNCHNMQRT